jgi:hypothetical protein
MMVCVFLSGSAPRPADRPAQDIKQAFHLAGIPGVSRQARVDLSFSPDRLVFRQKKTSFEIPYARIR